MFKVACLVGVVGLVGCTGPGDAASVGSGPSTVAGGPVPAVESVLAEQVDGVTVELTVTFAEWVQDQHHLLTVTADGVESSVSVDIADGLAFVALPVDDPCTQLGSQVEYTVAFGDSSATTVVELQGGPLVPADGFFALHTGDAPVALCGSDTRLRFYADAGTYRLAIPTGGFILRAAGDERALATGLYAEVALATGDYTLDLDSVGLTVVTR